MIASCTHGPCCSQQPQRSYHARFVWEDVVEQVPLPGQGPGLEGLKDILRGMRAAFPDLNFAIKEQIAEGDKVASRFEWAGTHQHEFLGVRATVLSVENANRYVDNDSSVRNHKRLIILDLKNSPLEHREIALIANGAGPYHLVTWPSQPLTLESVCLDMSGP